MPTEIKEGRYAGEYIVSRSNGSRSFEQVTLAAGPALPAGTVLGRVTATGKFTALDLAAVDGSAAAAGILYANVAESAGDRRAVAELRDMEANAHALEWPEGATAEQKAVAIAELETIGIIVRA